jgi:hypothetical protein
VKQLTSTKRRDWRTIIFRLVVVLLAGLVLSGPGGVADLIAPWHLTPQGSHGTIPELHRWHSADVTALVVFLIVGGMLALIPRPRQAPLVAQFVIFAAATLAIIVRGDALAPCLIIGGAFAIAYPAPRALLSLPKNPPYNPPVLVIALATLPFLAANGWANAQRLLNDTSEHAALGHWHGSLALTIVLALGGLAAATKLPGWTGLGTLLALAYAYLGAAALAVPIHDGSWGVIGGIIALFAAVAFGGATILIGRGNPQRKTTRESDVFAAA